jgi:hypothetical protein
LTSAICITDRRPGRGTILSIKSWIHKKGARAIMADKTPKEVIEDFEHPGILFLYKNEVYFINDERLKAFKLPESFQENAENIDPDYFLGLGRTQANFEEKSAVFRGLRDATRAIGLSGVESAIATEYKTMLDFNKVRSAETDQTLLTLEVLDEDSPPEVWPRILVDLSKGGKPSEGR